VSDAAARIEALVRSFERALNSFDAGRLIFSKAP
jgi:hypothetical protein